MAGHVRILLGAMFREVAGRKEILEKVSSNTTLGDILTNLAEKYGRDFNEIIDSKTGQISLETWVLVNGKSIRKTDIALKDSDVITISVPIGGG